MYGEHCLSRQAVL